MRVELDNQQNPCLSMRNNLKMKPIRLSYGLIVRLNDFSLRKYDAMLNVKLQKGLHFSLEHKTPSVDPHMMSVGKVVAGLSYKLDKKTKAAVQAYKVDDKVRMQAGIHTKLENNREVKMKVDNKGKLTTLLKGKLSN